MAKVLPWPTGKKRFAFSLLAVKLHCLAVTYPPGSVNVTGTTLPGVTQAGLVGTLLSIDSVATDIYQLLLLEQAAGKPLPGSIKVVFVLDIIYT